MNANEGWGRTALALLIVLAIGAPVEAQRVSREYYDDAHNGYRFRGPDDWRNIPPQPNELEFGIVCKMEGDEKLLTVSGKTYSTKPELLVILFREHEVSTEEPTEGGLRDRVSNERKRMAITDFLPKFFGGLRDLDMANPIDTGTVKVQKDLVGQRKTWKGFSGVMEMVIDTFTFPLEKADVCMVFWIPEDHYKKWGRVFEGCAKSFERTVGTGPIEVVLDGSYKNALAYQTEVVARTPGWRVLPTPSQKYVVVTSSTNTRFIDEVIDRLELSRALFEKDFPADHALEHISVVRICGTEEEFHSYGGTGSGVGGWFSPRTTELVLFDYKDINRNATYAVMSHEAFHQYCHFLFGESEAHRWFDEGLGDYYGGVEFKQGRAEITKKMPAGFDRLGPIKSMVQTGDYAPLRKHLNYTHQEWQNQKQGFSYAQSWSIIYMLRQGMLGNVSNKVWKPEYASIIPNYMAALHEGHKKAYAEILAEREAEAQAEGEVLDEEDRKIGRFDLEPERRKLIWKEAMDASWGKVDLREFEENWLTYVKKHL